MLTWYIMVCDEHKEACEIICCSNYYATFNYQEKDSDLLCAFFSKHYGCKLRLVHLDPDLDYLHDNDYLFLRLLNNNKEEERKKYVLENNNMFRSEDYDIHRQEVLDEIKNRNK